MKKILAIFILLFLMFSCSVVTEAPSWTNIGRDGVYIEYYQDTLSLQQLDSTLKSHKIKPSHTEWDYIKYYNIENKEEMMQFVYNKYAKGTKDIDTTFIVDNYKDEFILKIRVFNKL